RRGRLAVGLDVTRHALAVDADMNRVQRDLRLLARARREMQLLLFRIGVDRADEGRRQVLAEFLLVRRPPRVVTAGLRTGRARDQRLPAARALVLDVAGSAAQARGDVILTGGLGTARGEAGVAALALLARHADARHVAACAAGLPLVLFGRAHEQRRVVP